jgi:hypothetical protein
MAKDHICLDTLKSLTMNILVATAPLVAEHLHVMTAVDVLKTSVATYLIGVRQLSLEGAASHLGMSSRWMYKQLAKQKTLGEVEVRYPTRLEVLDFFGQRYPEPASIGDCAETVRTRPDRRPERHDEWIRQGLEIEPLFICSDSHLKRIALTFLHTAERIGQCRVAILSPVTLMRSVVTTTRRPTPPAREGSIR